MSRPLVLLYAGKSSGSISGLEKAMTKYCTLVCLSWTKGDPQPSHQPPSWQGQGWLGAVASTPAHIPALGFLKQTKPWAHLGMDGAAVTSTSLGERLGSSELQQGGCEGLGARPGTITAQPNHPVPSLAPQPLAKQTQQRQLAEPESCSRVSKTQQTHL